jgi:DNA-binding protein YbaB
MLGGLKNMAGLASMMKDLPRMQARMEEVKASLTTLRVEASSANGTVSVTASGDLRVESIRIDSATQVDDLGALVQVTVNEALDMARAEAQRRLAEAAEELGMPMPSGGALPGPF